MQFMLVALQYPVMHVHELVAGPVKVHMDCVPQPPLLVAQLLMATQLMLFAEA